MLTFALLFFGRKWPRYGWLIFIPGVLLALVGLFGNQALMRGSCSLFSPCPMVGLHLLAARG